MKQLAHHVHTRRRSQSHNLNPDLQDPKTVHFPQDENRPQNASFCLLRFVPESGKVSLGEKWP